ncbi:ubiquitin-like-conjugating enzyme ATG10 [Carica papaya]|uniref:ubiquitin-like-conjugating enzyme ATG10 n=1 Tax=Carica papaya TaxID=3649 RepID=UPI000B8CBBED|nr:ubiquitin-like-conjugating enzyme ATG10 [Carica papaya]
MGLKGESKMIFMTSIRTRTDVSSWDGTLSASEFYLAACAFADKWKMFNPAYPQWSWVSCPKQPFVASHNADKYLSLEKICVLRSSKEGHDEGSHIGKEGTECSKDEELIDKATLIQSDHHEAHYYDFHIVYSTSYRVPVLYLRAYYSDGRALSFDEIERDLPGCSAALLESKWTFLTQEEHPYLQRPWCKLHPCGTSEWIKLLYLGDVDLAKRGVAIDIYLLSWFSVVGQVVGLRVPFEMLNEHGYCS